MYFYIIIYYMDTMKTYIFRENKVEKCKKPKLENKFYYREPKISIHYLDKKCKTPQEFYLTLTKMNDKEDMKNFFIDNKIIGTDDITPKTIKKLLNGYLNIGGKKFYVNEITLFMLFYSNSNSNNVELTLDL
jgi:hypothetical protein